MESAWVTVRAARVVLFVVHNVTTVNRLLDVFPVFAGDFRVQFVVTSELDDPFGDGLLETVSGLGLPTVPWEQAVGMRFDLIVSASQHGSLTELDGPLVVLPHGIGHSKFAPGSTDSIFGISREWLLHHGKPFAAALVLSHTEQLENLRRHAPEAVDTAVVVGDPCFDRLVASRSRRDDYRRALGVAEDRTLVTVTSTWGAGSLLGTWPSLVDELVRDLPRDRFRVALVVHPNVWCWHGPYQLKVWWEKAIGSGLVLIPAVEGWRGTLVASDLLIGDHGSVTAYGAALGIPTALAAFPEERVVPGTAIHALGRQALRLVPGKEIRTQIKDFRGYDGIAELITSAPSEARRNLRRLCYATMDLAEPGTDAGPTPVPLDGLHSGTGGGVNLTTVQ